MFDWLLSNFRSPSLLAVLVPASLHLADVGWLLHWISMLLVQFTDHCTTCCCSAASATAVWWYFQESLMCLHISLAEVHCCHQLDCCLLQFDCYIQIFKNNLLSTVTTHCTMANTIIDVPFSVTIILLLPFQKYFGFCWCTCFYHSMRCAVLPAPLPVPWCTWLLHLNFLICCSCPSCCHCSLCCMPLLLFPLFGCWFGCHCMIIYFPLLIFSLAVAFATSCTVLFSLLSLLAVLPPAPLVLVDCHSCLKYSSSMTVTSCQLLPMPDGCYCCCNHCHTFFSCCQLAVAVNSMQLLTPPPQLPPLVGPPYPAPMSYHATTLCCLLVLLVWHHEAVTCLLQELF